MAYLDFKLFDIYNCPEYTCKHRTNFIKCGDPGKYNFTEKKLSNHLKLFFLSPAQKLWSPAASKFISPKIGKKIVLDD